MTAFFIILSVIFLLAAVALFLFFDTKLREARRQYRLLNNQYVTLKKKLSFSDDTLKNVKIKYVPPSFSSGITKENTPVYLSPIQNNLIVCELKEANDLKILEECVIANNIWLYVDLELLDNVNSRGWVEKKYFSFLKDKIQIV